MSALVLSDFQPSSHKLDPHQSDHPGYIAPKLMANFRGEGRVTTGCLWHACRAVTIGVALIITGISLTVIGYLSDQKEYHEHIELSRKVSVQCDIKVIRHLPPFKSIQFVELILH